jgi:hypothetical protein
MAKGSRPSGQGGSKRGPGGSASRAGAGASSGGGGDRRNRRGKAAPVKKPFPTGFVAGCVALVLVLGGILGYAILNTGSAFQTELKKADKQFTGLQVTNNLSQLHTARRVNYPDLKTTPPDGGNHNPYWYTCAVYTEPVVPEHAVHSLEHGAVWITYRPDLPADQVTTLTGLADGNAYVLLSPYPDLEAPVTLQAWGRRLEAQSASDPQVAKFVSVYADGPQNREQGAGCSGVITQAGTVPFVQTADGQFVPGSETYANAVPYNGKIPDGAGTPAGSTGTPDPLASDTPSPTPSAPAPVGTATGTPTP